MELIKLYRKNALYHGIAWGAVCAAAAVLLLVLLRGEAWGVIGLLFLVYVVYFAVSALPALTGLGARRYRRYLRSLPPGEEAELARRYGEGYRLGEAVLTGDCIVILTRRRLEAIPYGDILWIYELGQVTRLVGGITRTLTIATDDRRTHDFQFKSGDGERLQSFLDGVLVHSPGIALGYRRETARLFWRDLGRLRDGVRDARLAMERDREWRREHPEEEPPQSEEPSAE